MTDKIAIAKFNWLIAYIRNALVISVDCGNSVKSTLKHKEQGCRGRRQFLLSVWMDSD